MHDKIMYECHVILHEAFGLCFCNSSFCRVTFLNKYFLINLFLTRKGKFVLSVWIWQNKEIRELEQINKLSNTVISQSFEDCHGWKHAYQEMRDSSWKEWTNDEEKYRKKLKTNDIVNWKKIIDETKNENCIL